MNKHKWDEWLKSSLGNHTSELPSGGWKGLQASRKAKKRRPVIGLVTAIAASLASLGLVFYPGTVKNDQVAVDRIFLNGNAMAPAPAGKNEPHVKNEGTEPAGPEKAAVPFSHSPDAFGGEEFPEPAKEEFVSQDPFVKAEGLSLSSLPVEEIKLNNLQTGQSKIIGPGKTKRPALLWASFYIESRTEYGDLRMDDFVTPMVVFPASVDPGQYANLFNRSNLGMVSQSLGTGVSLHRNKLSLSFGIGLRYTEFLGDYDYSKLDPVPEPIGAGSRDPYLKFGQEVQAKNGRVKAEYQGWDLLLPLRLEYRFRNAAFSPYIGAGFQLVHNFKSKGRVVNVSTLESEGPGKGFHASPSLQWTFHAGYRIPVGNQNINLCYTWSPFATRFDPYGTKLGANMHGIGITFEMP